MSQTQREMLYISATLYRGGDLMRVEQLRNVEHELWGFTNPDHKTIMDNLKWEAPYHVVQEACMLIEVDPIKAPHYQWTADMVNWMDEEMLSRGKHDSIGHDMPQIMEIAQQELQRQEIEGEQHVGFMLLYDVNQSRSGDGDDFDIVWTCLGALDYSKLHLALAEPIEIKLPDGSSG